MNLLTLWQLSSTLSLLVLCPIWSPPLLSFLSQQRILTEAFMPRVSVPPSRRSSATDLWAPSCSFWLPQENINTHLFLYQMYFCFKAKEPPNHQTKSHFYHVVWKHNWGQGSHPEDEDPSLTTGVFLKSVNTALETRRKDIVLLLCFWFCVLWGAFLFLVFKWEKSWHPALWGEGVLSHFTQWGFPLMQSHTLLLAPFLKSSELTIH